MYIRSVCFSPDNKYLACGAEDHTVKVWDVENKRLHHTFVGHELDIYSLDFSRDGNLIVSGSGDKKAKIWDLEKGEVRIEAISSQSCSAYSRLEMRKSVQKMV